MGLINKELVHVNATAVTWEEAIQLGGNLLMQNGYINASYIDAMINNMLENGAYFVLAPGVAMPHARSEAGAIKTGISIVTLREPVKFLDTPNNPVKLVICLSAADSESHLDLLTKVSELLSDSTSVAAVMKAKTADEVLAQFHP